MSEQSNSSAIQAIEYPSGDGRNRQTEHVQQQPRQPHSLQGLIRFAMEATRSEDAPYESNFMPLDEERKLFLENALKSMTVDVIEELKKPIEKLQNASGLPTDFDISEYEAALETILGYIDDIDTANDFHKIGGFTIFPPCFACIHPQIRASACNILAELCQNNPYCQQVVMDNNMISTLLEMLKAETDEAVLVKAFYALSCNVRDNVEAYQQFRNLRGVSVLLTILPKPIDKLRSKCAFLLGNLCREYDDLKKLLISSLEIIPLVVDLILQERWPSHEHIIELLYILVDSNPYAFQECSKQEYNLKNVLLQHYETYKDKDECQEEITLCVDILEKVFGYKI